VISLRGMRGADSDNLTETNRLLQKLRLDYRQRENPPGPQHARRIATASLLAVLGAGAGSFYLRGKRFEIETATAIAPSTDSGSSAILQATGYVVARRQATVSAPITGMLTQVLINEGEHVWARQVIAQLENTAQQAALAQTQAQVRAAEARLSQYYAQLAQARRDLKRSNDLVARQLVSEQAFENAKTQVATLRSNSNASRRRWHGERCKARKGSLTTRPFGSVLGSHYRQGGSGGGDRLSGLRRR